MLIEYERLQPNQGIPYGIRIDASDANIYDSQGHIDLTKLPLKIGKLSDPPFTVNWKGEMTATAGLIGGWSIGSDRLSSTNGSGKLVLSSNPNITTPLIIGDNFSVNWNGTVNATDIKINGGTLSGVINASGTTIKNVTIVNNNGQSLKIDDDGYLDLSQGTGIRFGTGITLDTAGYSGLVTDSLWAKKKITTQSFTVGQGGSLVVFGHGLRFIEIEGHYVLGYG